MTEPDDLYTLRAQFWLGHYGMAADEAKTVMRRPMSPALKVEREEIAVKCQLAMGQTQKVISATEGSSIPGVQILGLKARYEAATDDESKETIVRQIQTIVADGDASVLLTAAQVFLMAGMKKEALQCVHAGQTMEHIALCLQLYLQIDRIDLAQQQLQLLKRKDEDSILTQLGSVYILLATGSSVAGDAVHTLTQLSEQYGPSVFLLNLIACAFMQQGAYDQAEQRLQEAMAEAGTVSASANADTVANMIVCAQYLQKPTAELVQQLKMQFPMHFLAKGLNMVESAFDRESIKYKVEA